MSTGTDGDVGQCCYLQKETTVDKLYRVMDNDVDGSGNKLQLSAFTCKCYKCKKEGHMAKDCKSSGKLSNLKQQQQRR